MHKSSHAFDQAFDSTTTIVECQQDIERDPQAPPPFPQKPPECLPAQPDCSTASLLEPISLIQSLAVTQCVEPDAD